MTIALYVQAWEAEANFAERLVFLAFSEICSGNGLQHFWTKDMAKLERLTSLPPGLLAATVDALEMQGVLTYDGAHSREIGGEIYEVQLGDRLLHLKTAVMERMREEARITVPRGNPFGAPRRSGSGHVYVVGGGGYYKIGKARDLSARMRWFELKLPFEVELVLSIESADYSALELELHGIFAHKRANGEWFALNRDDLIRIRSEYGAIG